MSTYIYSIYFPTRGILLINQDIRKLQEKHTNQSRNTWHGLFKDVFIINVRNTSLTMLCVRYIEKEYFDISFITLYP